MEQIHGPACYVHPLNNTLENRLKRCLQTTHDNTMLRRSHPKGNHRMQPRQPAFTLVELLVVIAIMSILAALLLPALQDAIAQARRIKCTSNVKQMYVGLQFYTHDFAGYLPRVGSNYPNDFGTSLIYWPAYVSHEYLNHEYRVWTADIPNIMTCPNDPAPRFYWCCGTFSYGMNIKLFEFRFTRMRTPSQTLMLGDAEDARYIISGEVWDGTDTDYTLGFWHRQTAIIGYGDGHTAGVEPGLGFYTDPTPFWQPE